MTSDEKRCDAPNKVRGYEVTAFQWGCPCGHRNLASDICRSVVGSTQACAECGAESKIDSIMYSTGVVMYSHAESQGAE